MGPAATPRRDGRPPVSLFLGQIGFQTRRLPTTERGIIGNGGRSERFIVLEQMDEHSIDLMRGVKGGLHLALAPADRIQEGGREIAAVTGELKAQAIERLAEKGIALLGHRAVVQHIAAATEAGGHASLAPDLIRKQHVLQRARARHIARDEGQTGTRERQEVAGWRRRKERFQVLQGLLGLQRQGLVVRELSLQQGRKSGGDIGRGEQSAFDHGKEFGGSFGATAIAVSVEELDYPRHAKFADGVGIGAKGDQGAHQLPFQRAGGQRGRDGQVGMGAAKAAGVEKRAGNELIKSPEQAVGAALLFRLERAEAVHLLAHDQLRGRGQPGGETKPAHEQVADRTQIEQIGLVEGERRLRAVEFDLIGVDEVVEEARRGPARQLLGVAKHQVARPTLVVDAGRLVAEHDQLRVMLRDQAVQGAHIVLIPRLEGGHFQRGQEQESRAGVEGRPVHVLANVQGGDEHLIGRNTRRKLAERLGPASLNVLQLCLAVRVLTHGNLLYK